MSNPTVRLADTPDGPGRSAASLVASLAARFAALYATSGADAIASLTAGFAALGREVGMSAEGTRLRQALASGRAGANGNLLWSRLRLAEWTSGIYPSPVLDQLRNDVALLLAEDLDRVLATLPIPSSPFGAEAFAELPPVEFLDVLLGLWAFSRELTRAVETLAAPSLASGRVVTGAPPDPSISGSILR